MKSYTGCNRSSGLAGCLATMGLAALFVVPVAAGEDSAAPLYDHATPGTITGIVRGRARMPVAGATITAAKLDGSSIRATISSSEGIYSFADVTPGSYSVSSEVDGYPRAVIETVLVNAGRAARTDIAMTQGPDTAPPNAPAPNLAAAKPPGRPAPQSFPAPPHEEGSFLGRWLRGESMSWRDLETHPAETSKRRPPSDPGVVASLGAPPLTAANMPALNASLSVPAVEGSAAPVAVPENAAKKKIDPFSDWDWTWLNGQSRQKDSPLDGKYFSGEFRSDAHYGLDFNQPKDHTMGGSSELFRSGEVQLEELALGGDFHVDNVRGRVLYLVGLFSTTTPRNDASAAVGQWDVRDAYRYVSEAWGGYHFNVNYGLNIDAGIFVSYVGLFSYHNFDNWAYQPSYVSSNTPWFFNGVRVQWFPTAHLKIEPWFINGWQSYNKFNSHPGLGGQLRWTPKPWLNVISNNYGYGTDTLGIARRQRYHTDNSVEVKYFDNQESLLDKAAFTVTGDLGCESGGGVSCTGKGAPKQAFLGYMAYNRFWFHKDLFGLTLGGGQISNPGRYLTLVLPVNGADAISGTPYFTGNPGDKFKAYDATTTFDYMPRQYLTFRAEVGYRHANVPYFTGRNGITPPGGNNGYPAQFVCNDGTPSPTGNCSANGGLWKPDLRRSQTLLLGSIMVKF